MKIPRKTIAKVAEVIFSNVDKVSVHGENPVRLCNYTNVYYNRFIRDGLDFMQGTATDREIERFKLKKGDVIITKDSEEADDIAIPAYVAEDIANLVCGYHLAIIRPKKGDLDGRYLSQLLQMHSIRHYFATLANGVTRYGLGTDAISNAMLYFLPYREQCKIADILSTWDEAWEKLDALIAAKERQKKGLMQVLLQKATKDSQHGHARCRMGDVFERVVRKNPDGDKNVLTISAEHGLISQTEYFNKSVAGADTSKYYQLNQGEFAYNRSSSRGVPYGAICRLDRYVSGIVSVLYICFRIKNPKTVSSNYLMHYFNAGLLNPGLRAIAKEGARAHGLLNVTAEEFFDLDIVLPDYKRQNYIADILDAADRELCCMRKQRNLLESQKRGLMQQLLTGKVRVKI